MLFCKKCGSILVPKKGQMVCPRCSYKSKEKIGTQTTKESDSSFTIKERVKQKEKPEIEIVEEEKEALPIVDRECPKCGNKQAYFWEIQTRAADEPATQFFRCTKCKHTWRHYD